MSRVTLIGGHGKVALLAAPLLVSDGHDVASVVRNPEHVAAVEATGAAAAMLDVEHATTEQIARDLVRGSDVVVWSAGAGNGSPAAHVCRRPRRRDPLDGRRRCRPASARYVMVSYFGAGPDHGVPAGQRLLRLRRGQDRGRRAPAGHRPRRGRSCARAA